MKKEKGLELVRENENNEINENNIDFSEKCCIDLFLKDDGSIFGLNIDYISNNTSCDLIELCKKLHIHYEINEDFGNEVSISFKDKAEYRKLENEFEDEGFVFFCNFKTD